MQRILCAALMAVILATPAFAAKLYLKEGGVIQAKRVWRSGGRVYVLATRDTMTSFGKSEINMKRTFPKKHRSAKKNLAVKHRTATAAPHGAAATQKAGDTKVGISLPGLPKLPDGSPGSLAPSSSGSGGTIRQQQKEMAEKIAE